MKSDGVSQGSYPACPSSSSKPRETVSQQGCGLSVFTCPKVGRDTRTWNYDRAGLGASHWRGITRPAAYPRARPQRWRRTSSTVKVKLHQSAVEVMAGWHRADGPERPRSQRLAAVRSLSVAAVCTVADCGIGKT